MALTRRSVNRMAGSIWPGFVDAMTALLLVLMFVLTIFMVVQFVLRETISGQESELDALSAQVADLADALGLERSRAAGLETSLGEARDEADAQAALIATLTANVAAQEAELTARAARITTFEAQVATLLTERDQAREAGAVLSATIAELEANQARLISEQEALNLALATARDEIDAGMEAARLAAARREALEALIADLERDAGEREATLTAAQDALSAEEAARLVDQAAAEALRERLKTADDELTAMTLALEEERRRAEDTLTLLAAAQAAQGSVDEQLVAALSEAEKQAALLAVANQALAAEEAASAEAARKVALLNEQVASLRAQLGSLNAILDEAAAQDDAARVQIEALGSRLNAALAQVASEQRKRAELEEAERKRLEEEAKELAAYRSEFFGKLREVLGDREGVRVVGDRFVFSSEVLFATGDATLAPEGRAQIANVAAILSEVADEIPPEIDWIIRVDGHTDNIPLAGTGEYANNWELSQARALSVVSYMTEQLGFPPDRLAATGFGEFQPVNPADTDQARAQNRRIELKLTER